MLLHVWHRLACSTNICFINKISASELIRKFIKSALLVGVHVCVCTAVSSLGAPSRCAPKMRNFVSRKKTTLVGTFSACTAHN